LKSQLHSWRARWFIAELRRLFQNQPWKNRIAYAFMLLLAVLYLLSQIVVGIVWLAGEAQLDSL
jgi:hypothetical protein